ncbi:MAG TPA: acyl-CoA dehydrogenase family protein [Candidatus Limnocylindrales bacterium]|nr:acyl-CoA dehydrogenase family protein [Candidatus Limnocylindrales bacterium]
MLEEVRRIADEILFPKATARDREGVLISRSELEPLASAGVFGCYVPRRWGGLEWTEETARELYAVLAGGCAATAFVWMQHQSLARKLTTSPNTTLAAAVLPDLAAGRLIAGDVNYLRRVPPAVRAHRDGDGFRLDGHAPWVASWGIADLYLVAAVDDEDIARYFAVRADAPGLHAAQQLEILAVRTSGCVRLHLDGVRVEEDQLVESLPWIDWRARDVRRRAQPMPPVFGIAERALRLLEGFGYDEATAALTAELADCKAYAWGLPDEAIEEQLAARGRSHELALRITGALVAAGGGRSVQLENDAQRLLREAAFFSIQSQSEPVRAATMQAFTAVRR